MPLCPPSTGMPVQSDSVIIINVLCRHDCHQYHKSDSKYIDCAKYTDCAAATGGWHILIAGRAYKFGRDRPNSHCGTVTLK